MPEDPKPEPRMVTREQQAQEQARQVAREAAAEPEKPMPEEVPGGRYIVDGETVDAEGKPVGKG